jgi:hypothetical protein
MRATGVQTLGGGLHSLRVAGRSDLNEEFAAGHYACRPPGMPHGPFISQTAASRFRFATTLTGTLSRGAEEPTDEMLAEIDATHDEPMSAAILDLYRSAVPNLYADWGAGFDKVRVAGSGDRGPGMNSRPATDLRRIAT